MAGRTQRTDGSVLPAKLQPELNPEECFNTDLKQVIARKVAVRTKVKLRGAAEQRMHIIGNEPERVKAYFRDSCVKYAA